jgi:SWI/SNF-related matrix-associated actin-dependent regulator of chromatin subfamily B protein 1
MNGFPQKPPQTQQQGGTGGGNIFPSQSPLSSQPHIPLPQTQTPQQQRGGQAFSSQQQHESSPPPMSPYRGAKRKVGGPDGVMPGMGSPRMGGGMALPPTTPTGAMGPPGIPRTVSGDSLGGIPSPSTGGLGNMNMNAGMQGGAGNLFQPPAQNQSLHQHHQQLQRRTQSPRPQSSMGMVPGGGMDIQIQRQRQGSNPPQFPLGNQQTPQRQGSLPPSGMMGPPPQMSKPLDPAGLMGIGVKSGISGMSGMPGMVMPPPSAAPANPLAGMHPPTAAPGVISGGIPLPGPGSVPGGPGMGVGGVTPQQQQALASSLSAAGIPTAPGGLPAAGSSVSGAGSAAANLLAQLPPLPPGVTLNPAITRVSAVPLIESVKRIPPLSEADIKNVQAWIKVDKEYEVVFRRMKERMALEARETFGPAGASWWEKGFLGGNLNRWRRGREQFDVRYPRRREKEGRDGRERKRGVRREGLRLYVDFSFLSHGS